MADRFAISLEACASAVGQWQSEGHKVVLTNGVFDILHVGHVAVLETAAAQGDRLVVAVNADASVKRLGKGDARPYNHQEDRAQMLAALRCVDAVVLFDEDTPLNVVQALRPDVLVKGGDYDPSVSDPSNPKYIVGSAEVRTSGGSVVAVPLVPGRSTTTLVERIDLGPGRHSPPPHDGGWRLPNWPSGIRPTASVDSRRPDAGRRGARRRSPNRVLRRRRWTTIPCRWASLWSGPAGAGLARALGRIQPWTSLPSASRRVSPGHPRLDCRNRSAGRHGPALVGRGPMANVRVLRVSPKGGRRVRRVDDLACRRS